MSLQPVEVLQLSLLMVKSLDAKVRDIDVGSQCLGQINGNPLNLVGAISRVGDRWKEQDTSKEEPKVGSLWARRLPTNGVINQGQAFNCEVTGC